MAMCSRPMSTGRGTLRAAVLAAACAFAAPALAQLDHTTTPVADPDQPNAIEIGTPRFADAKAQESWHSQYGSQFARNVTVATITPFLPDPPGPAAPASLRQAAASARCRWRTKAGMWPALWPSAESRHSSSSTD